MTEIPKNPTNIPQQPQKVEQVKAETVEEQQPAAVTAEPQTKEITEIKENPADRSAVKVDNLENDMKVFTSNPELAQKAMEIAELAQKRYEASGVENAQEKALKVGEAFIKEFQ